MAQFISAILDSDANHYRYAGNNAFRLESTWTFVASTTGAVAAHTLFTVTDNCLVQVFGICDTDITGSGTGEVGVAGNTAALIAQTTGTAIDDGEIWIDATPGTGVEGLPGTFILNDGTDILLTIATDTWTAGKIDFYCIWRPLNENANITVTTAA